MRPSEPFTAVLERLTTGQLARLAGVAPSTVLRWRRGARPRPRARERLRALGVITTT